jgi:hypothetical protein
MLHIAGGVFLGLIFFTLFMAFLPLIVITVIVLVVLLLAIIGLTVYGVLAYYFTIPILALTIILATAISYNIWRSKRDDKERNRLIELYGPNFYYNSTEGIEWHSKTQKRGYPEGGYAMLAIFIFFNVYFLTIVSNPWELATTLASVYGYIILYITTLLVIAFIIMGIQWCCKRTFRAVVNALPHRP